MSHPWLTVLLPTFNGEAYLPAALAAAAEQAEDGLEIIAVDDGSQDATLALLDSYRGRVSLRVLRRCHTGNWVANANLALSLARTEYCTLLPQDDFWLPGRLRVLRRWLDAAPDAVLLVHPVAFVDAQGRHLGWWRCPLPAGRPLPGPSVLGKLHVQNFLAAVAPDFRRDVALRIGGLDERLWYAADWDLWLKLATLGPTLCGRRPLAAFRLHPRQQTAWRSSDVEDVRNQLRAVLDRHLAAFSATVPEKVAGVQEAAEVSLAVNAWLFACWHGRPRRAWDIVACLLGLGWAGVHRYLRDSRIVERTLPRLRARLASCFRRATLGAVGGK